MTCVYSVSSRPISICSNCAAPRMPPSGFLISCARLRMSSLLACAWSVSRSSRSCRVCCSSGNSSTTASPNLSVWATTTCTGIGSWVRRFSHASYRNAANSLLPAPANALSKPCGSVKQSGNSDPSIVRREVPSASSSAALAKITVPSVCTTAIKVASKSKDWKRA